MSAYCNLPIIGIQKLYSFNSEGGDVLFHHDHWVAVAHEVEQVIHVLKCPCGRH